MRTKYPERSNGHITIWVQGCKGARVQGCKGARVQGCKGARCKGARVQGCKGARVQGVQGARRAKVQGCTGARGAMGALDCPDVVRPCAVARSAAPSPARPCLERHGAHRPPGRDQRAHRRARLRRARRAPGALAVGGHLQRRGPDDHRAIRIPGLAGASLGPLRGRQARAAVGDPRGVAGSRTNPLRGPGHRRHRLAHARPLSALLVPVQKET